MAAVRGFGPLAGRRQVTVGEIALVAMQVRVRLFAGLRERAGTDELALELADGASVRDALEQMRGLTTGVPVVMAVNREYASDDQTLDPGDEIALIPARLRRRGRRRSRTGHERAARARPAGGARQRSASRRRRHVPRRDPRGVRAALRGVRGDGDQGDGADRRGPRSSVTACARRPPSIGPGSCRCPRPSVAIAVSAPHRDAAFAGGREIIDRIKAQAPIWKQEEGAWLEGVTPS